MSVNEFWEDELEEFEKKKKEESDEEE